MKQKKKQKHAQTHFGMHYIIHSRRAEGRREGGTEGEREGGGIEEKERGVGPSREKKQRRKFHPQPSGAREQRGDAESAGCRVLQ